jgi:hypothetical protein
MKTILIIVAAAGIIGLSFISKSKTASKSKEISSKLVNGSYAPVAVLELFTSEGCSSCPSADRLLPQLALLDSNVIPLSFHVDYWNRLGWTDPFSSSEYSERQRNYSRQLNLESVYTPQLVVNGEYELVGSNRIKAETTIKSALQEKAAVQLSIDIVKMNADKINFKVHSEGNINKTNVLAALVQKQVTMNVKTGENRGAKLSHTNVVRSLLVQTAADYNEFEITVPANLARDNWQLIVYTQQKNNLKITGASIYYPIQ